jgi:DNA-binding IscR family transcriptional regulator
MATETGLDLGGGLWLPISEIARIEKKSRQAISKRVKGLAAAGKLETRPGPAGSMLVNLAAYKHAIGEAGDAIKELAAETRAAEQAAPAQSANSAEPTLRDAQTRRALFEADLKQIELGRALGELVPIADVEEAQQRSAEAIVRVLDRLPNYGDEIAAAVGKDGPAGARSKLKEITRLLRAAVAEALTAKLDEPPAAVETTAPAPAPIADAEPACAT